MTLYNPPPKIKKVSATNYVTSVTIDSYANTTVKFIITAQAGDLLFNNPTGTPDDVSMIWIAITSASGTKNLTWDTQFVDSVNVTRPTTVGTTRLNIGFAYIVATSQWEIVALA